jgi:hypothetical protein
VQYDAKKSPSAGYLKEPMSSSRMSLQQEHALKRQFGNKLLYFALSYRTTSDCEKTPQVTDIL